MTVEELLKLCEETPNKKANVVIKCKTKFVGITTWQRTSLNERLEPSYDRDSSCHVVLFPAE